MSERVKQQLQARQWQDGMARRCTQGPDTASGECWEAPVGHKVVPELPKPIKREVFGLIQSLMSCCRHT